MSGPAHLPPTPTVTYAGTPVDVTSNLNRRKKSRVIPPDRRKKVAQACDTCKKRKQRCNGLQPCQLCITKNLECAYTAIDRRVLKPSKKQLNQARNDDSPSEPTQSPPLRKSYKDTVDTSRVNTPPTSGSEHHQQQQYPHLQQWLEPTVDTPPPPPPPPQISMGIRPQMGLQQQQQHMPSPQVTQVPFPQQPLPPHQQFNPYHYPQHPHPPPPPRGAMVPQPPPPPPPPPQQQQQYMPQIHSQPATVGPSQHVRTTPPQYPPPPPQQQQHQQQQHRSSNDNTVDARRSGTASPASQAHKRAQIPASLQPLLSFPLNIQPGEVHDESFNDTMFSLGNDQNWRLLFDQGGHLRYLGESSGTAYLLQCRKLFHKVLGQQKFSEDPERFTFVDAPGVPLAPRSPVQLPERQYTDYLVKTYLNNLNNVLYVLDDDSLIQLVDRVYNSQDLSSVPAKDMCILYFVLAIGSVYSQVEIPKKLFPFPPDYFTDPIVFFESGMTILNTTVDDGNIWLAEAHLLIFFFYQFTGYKNTAWIKLGSAIRYAQGLGLNRKFVNESYKDPNFVLHRRKLFRSLFIMDTLSSIHLGRSMTIRHSDWDDIKSFESIDDYQSKLLKVCELNAKILDNVYYNPSVTLKQALNIAVDLKVYTLQNPIKPVSPENYPAPVDHKYLLPHVIYLHGIILLARPFFHFIILHKLGLIYCDPNSKNLPHLHNFYHSCIKASLLIVKIVEYCYYQNIHPFKPLSLVSCTFHAGLVLGLLLLLKLKKIDDEMFKKDPHINVDPDAMLAHAMASVIKVLVHYGKIDLQSRRYASILQNMLDVTKNLPEHLVDGNESDSSSSQAAHERNNTQQNFENILRFQDWLFPKAESLPMGSTAGGETGYNSSESGNMNEDFLKDIAGLNNVDTSETQFLDDFLYNVIDTNNTGSSRSMGGAKNNGVSYN